MLVVQARSGSLAIAPAFITDIAAKMTHVDPGNVIFVRQAGHKYESMRGFGIQGLFRTDSPSLAIHEFVNALRPFFSDNSPFDDNVIEYHSFILVCPNLPEAQKLTMEAPQKCGPFQLANSRQFALFILEQLCPLWSPNFDKFSPRFHEWVEFNLLSCPDDPSVPVWQS